MPKICKNKDINTDNADEFISMDSIKSYIFKNKSEKEINEEINYLERKKILKKKGIIFYQLQGLKDKSQGYLIEIGKFTKKPIIQIGKHINNNFKFEIINCIHSKDDLLNYSKKKEILISIIMVKIYKYDKHVLNIWFNFNTQFNNNFEYYLLNKNNFYEKEIRYLNGFYSIDLINNNNNNNRIILESFKKFPAQKKIIELVINKFHSNQVQQILNTFTN